MTSLETAKSKWAQYKPQLIALAIGLVLGPFISNYMGWQVTSSRAAAQVQAGIVDVQAGWCETAARAAVPEPGKLDWSSRIKLAEKWSVLPGMTEANSAVASACETKLQS